MTTQAKEWFISGMSSSVLKKTSKYENVLKPNITIQKTERKETTKVKATLELLLGLCMSDDELESNVCKSKMKAVLEITEAKKIIDFYTFVNGLKGEDDEKIDLNKVRKLIKDVQYELQRDTQDLEILFQNM